MEKTRLETEIEAGQWDKVEIFEKKKTIEDVDREKTIKAYGGKGYYRMGEKKEERNQMDELMHMLMKITEKRRRSRKIIESFYEKPRKEWRRNKNIC